MTTIRLRRSLDAFQGPHAPARGLPPFRCFLTHYCDGCRLLSMPPGRHKPIAARTFCRQGRQVEEPS